MLTILDWRLLDLRDGQRVLDAGCGGGWHTHEICKRIRGLMVGADMDKGSLLWGENWLFSHADKYNLPGRATFMQADASRLPFPDNTFDRILCTEVMEHVPDDRATLRELVRVLKPGGKIVVSVPTYPTEVLLTRLSYLVHGQGNRRYFNSPGGHVRMYRIPKIVGLLKESGLRLQELRFEHSLHTFLWLFRVIDDKSRLAVKYYDFVQYREQHESRGLQRLAWLANWFLPKALVLYARKAA